MNDLLTMANLSLDLLGHRQLNSLEDTSNDTRTVKRWVNLTLETIIRKYRWGFTNKIVELSAIPQKINGKTAYPLPSDYVVLKEVNNGYLRDFTINGGYLLADTKNYDTIDLCYYSNDLQLLNTAPSTFIMVFVNELAGNLAMPLTKSEKFSNYFKSESERLAMTACYTNDIETKNSKRDRVMKQSLLTSRLY